MGITPILKADSYSALNFSCSVLVRIRFASSVSPQAQKSKVANIIYILILLMMLKLKCSAFKMFLVGLFLQ